MSTVHTQSVPADVLDRITTLAMADNRPQGRAELTTADLLWVYAYCDRLLLGGEVLARHLTHLEKIYQAGFRRFASHRDRTAQELAIPGGPDTRFRHHTLLMDSQRLAILEHGPFALGNEALFPQGAGVESAKLLLNPYALWDLTDWIVTLLPDYWFSRQTEYAEELAAEVGIDLTPGTPLLAKPTS